MDQDENEDAVEIQEDDEGDDLNDIDHMERFRIVFKENEQEQNPIPVLAVNPHANGYRIRLLRGAANNWLRQDIYDEDGRPYAFAPMEIDDPNHLGPNRPFQDFSNIRNDLAGPNDAEV